ncbi:hypothetical protein AB0B78_31905 [Streptomyces sp. NPDC040724]|uniref:dTMP kinase n=1 Tax=Streptomyces sp. NPDC040724 TaxID=3155612 RepID=UPI0033CF53E5
MLIVIEGIDGSGKSTLAALVARTLAPDRPVPAGKKHLVASDPGTGTRADGLRRLIWSSDESAGDTFGAAHWILLIASWYAALARLRPDLRDPDTVTVMDGWYYRNIAKTLVREPLDASWVESLFAPVPEPDLAVLLDVRPETAWSRRDGFKDTELGRWDGYDGPPREAFIAYQGVIREQLARMAADRGWLVIAPDPAAPPEEIAAVVVRHIRALTAR